MFLDFQRFALSDIRDPEATVSRQTQYRKAARESSADAFLLKKTVMAELIPTLKVLVPTVPVKPKEGS